jgi:hypothetical protein
MKEMTEKPLVLKKKITRLLKLSQEAMVLSTEIFRDVIVPQNIIQKFNEVLNGVGLATKILTGKKIELKKEFPEKKKISIE